MDRAENQVATALRPTESHINTASIFEAGALPSRTDNTWPRSGATSAQEHLPDLQLTDGNRVLVADTSDNKPATKIFQLGAEQSACAAYADAQGEVPFGPALKGYADASKTPSTSYYSTTFGIDREGPNGHKQAINVNIGDGMKVNGQAVTDALPHRSTFPIAAEKGGDPHWKWIDATVTVKNGHGNLVVHRVSASESKPTKESDWEQVNVQYPLRHQAETQHLDPKEYWYCNTPGQRFFTENVSSDYRRANIGATVVLR